MKACNRCNSRIDVIETPNLVHYGKYVCSQCNKFQGWYSNPDKVGRSKTSKVKIQQLVKFKGYSHDFCFFCLRTKEELGIKETMTLDHIKELQEGGEDTVNNLQILCSACHKLKNWARLYMNWHLRDKE